MSARLVIILSRCDWTNGLQLVMSQLDEKGPGRGYRLAGPKFNGSGRGLLTATLTQRDADEIRSMLDAVFPTADNDDV